ncbi:hypothetical protein CEXT_253041 [Caerostris extrusa]|uniref:Uncharacterized protein n=1 Tax=Caerostris extrusa TaxID=172846 RepID=A0AAV4XXP7_CAEEX|nr:hypothetical protein CEXT_253041 [Caerostris extrusa]
MTIASALTMKVLVFSLFLLFGMSDACIEDDECNELNPIGDFLEVGFLPNGELLLNLCPKTLQFFECANRNIKECQGKTFEELAYVNDCKDESCISARVALAYLTFDKATKELCNRSSALHQGYMDNIDCIKNVLRYHDNCDGIITGDDEKISEVLNNIENEQELSIRKVACKYLEE